MYSGTTLTRSAGRVMGAHQKIDRVARRQLAGLLGDDEEFPSAQLILHFEGRDGPDGIKRKSPAVDEPWHYIDPFDKSDRQLINLINAGYKNLVKALKQSDEVRAAFEAAWLAHALVDGLTPAHHFPYESKLAELRGGAAKETRDSIKAKLILPGATPRERLENNWKMWGPKGLLMTHAMFEWDIATVLKPLSVECASSLTEEFKRLKLVGLADYFLEQALVIAKLEMFAQFYARGWTRRLARETKNELLPRMVSLVTLAWYAAASEASSTAR